MRDQGFSPRSLICFYSLLWYNMKYFGSLIDLGAEAKKSGLNMPPEDFHAHALMTHVKRLWIHGFLAGLAVVLIILAVSYFIWGWPLGAALEGQEEATVAQTPAAPPAPSSQVNPGPPAAAAETPATVKLELEAVLARLVEANRHKDLPSLLSLYDPAFPDLPQKAEEISRTWKIYDYQSLRFRIEEIQTQAPGKVTARVIWEADTRNRATQELKRISITYLAGFTNESGSWRILSLEKTGQPAERDKS